MAEIQHSQIKAKLLETTAAAIDVSDIQNKPAPDFEAHLLSRCIAVTALRMAAGIELTAAAGALVDGGKDNGIDAIYYDPQTRTLFLVQSKWSASHSASIDSAGVLKFLQGTQDLVSLKKDRFNQKTKDKWELIEDASKRLTSVRMIMAYPGSGRIDQDIQDKLNDFIQSQNDTSEIFVNQTISQKELFQYFVQEAAPPQINLTIRLSHFGLVDAPLKAVYGQVSATDVAGWYRQYGNQLFSGNIRHFLGIKSDVNLGISKTLDKTPDNFWYFNNGLTIIAQAMQKQAFGGNDRSVGVFDCENITIVNGAQTVGSIGQTLGADESIASVQARVIIVDDPDSIIGKEITRASNTQNRIDARNFVALDPEQERIRTELLIDKVDYEYREGENIESPSKGFEFIEAVTTLACAGSEISYVALAKGYVGGLYNDINTAPYKALFNASTSSKRLWSIIKLARRLDQTFREAHDQNSNVERGIIVHGNRMLTHLGLRELANNSDISASDSIGKQVVDAAVSKLLLKMSSVIEAHYADAYLAPLFKNVGKCADVRDRVEG